jgi:hypothetical protein
MGKSKEIKLRVFDELDETIFSETKDGKRFREMLDKRVHNLKRPKIIIYKSPLGESWVYKMFKLNKKQVV